MDTETAQVLMAFITVAGTVTTAVLTSRAKGHATKAKGSAREAYIASLRPLRPFDPGVEDAPDTPRDPSIRRSNKP